MTYRPRRDVRSALQRLALVGCSLVIAVLLAELLVRALPTSVWPEPVLDDPDAELWSDPAWRTLPPRAFQPDPDLGYVNAPDVTSDVKIAEHADRAIRFRTNSYGLRSDDDVTVPKPPGAYRILVLGDSQTAGYVNGDETYAYELNRLLQAHEPEHPIEVLNAGVSGYSPLQAYLWYRERGIPLEPDLVIFAVYVGNDLNDLAFGPIDGAIVDELDGQISPLGTPGAWIARHSELVRRTEHVVRGTLAGPLERLGLNIGPPLPPEGLEPLVRVMRECHGCWLQSLKQAVRARTHPDEIGRALVRLGAIFRLLSDDAVSTGSQVVILLIPTKTQVEPADERGAVDRAARLLKLTDRDLAYDRQVYGQIADIARQSGAIVIDPLDELREAARPGRLYYRRDWHLNPDGNRALAGALARSLEAHGISTTDTLALAPTSAGIEQAQATIQESLVQADERR